MAYLGGSYLEDRCLNLKRLHGQVYGHVVRTLLKQKLTTAGPDMVLNRLGTCEGI